VNSKVWGYPRVELNLDIKLSLQPQIQGLVAKEKYVQTYQGGLTKLFNSTFGTSSSFKKLPLPRWALWNLVAKRHFELPWGTLYPGHIIHIDKWQWTVKPETYLNPDFPNQAYTVWSGESLIYKTVTTAQEFRTEVRKIKNQLGQGWTIK
jgi:hypothetical protein